MNKLMPIMRVDNWVIFPGQPHRDRKLTLVERLKWKLGRRQIR